MTDHATARAQENFARVNSSKDASLQRTEKTSYRNILGSLAQLDSQV